jgi:hypothetical protein
MKPILSLMLLSILISCSSGSKKNHQKIVEEKTVEVTPVKEKPVVVTEKKESKGLTTKQKEEIKKALTFLSTRKNDNPVVIVTEKSGNQFVQFLPRGSGFLFDFPSEQLNANQIETAKKVLAPYKITFYDTYIGLFSGVVSNSDTVVEITEKMITEVFGVSGDIDIKIEEILL